MKIHNPDGYIEKGKLFDAIYDAQQEGKLKTKRDYLEFLHTFPVADVGKWHKVSDELPKISGSYIISTDKGSVCTAHFYADCGKFNAPFGKSVVYWMPLPIGNNKNKKGGAE